MKMKLYEFIKRQLSTFIPDNFVIANLKEAVFKASTKTLEIIRTSSVNGWETEFNHLNSSQYPIFLYLLSRELVKNGDSLGADKVFYLNKIINSIDLYHNINLGMPFLLGHAIGSVFCNSMFGNYNVFYQGILIGINNSKRPTIGSGIILFPGCKILGETSIGNNVVISAGTIIVDKVIPPNVKVFQGEKGKIIMKDLDELYCQRYFKLDETKTKSLIY